MEIAELIGPSTHTLNAKAKKDAAPKPEITVAPEVGESTKAADTAISRSADSL
jgi:hypothetical protein